MKITITALYSAGECVAPENWNTTARPRPYRLYFVLDGAANYTVGGEKTELLPGHFYLFPSSMPFNASQDKTNRLNHLYYDFMMTPSVVSAEPLVCSANAHSLFAPLLEVMRSSVKEYRYGGHTELYGTVVSALEAFLSLFLEIAMPKRTMDADIVRALEYIEQNYAEEISVGTLANLVFLDEDYFIKKFKKNLGITPYAYIKNLRMAVVRELRHSGETLSQASASAGFKYASSYCRAKRKKSENPSVGGDAEQGAFAVKGENQLK